MKIAKAVPRTSRVDVLDRVLDKGVSPNDKSHAALRRFGTQHRTEFTPDLRARRDLIARGEPFPVPDPAHDWRDWYDGQPIRDM